MRAIFDELMRQPQTKQRYYMMEAAKNAFDSVMLALNTQIGLPIQQREKIYSRAIEVLRPLSVLEQVAVGSEFQDEAKELVSFFERVKNGFDIPTKKNIPDQTFVKKLWLDYKHSLGEGDLARVNQNIMDEALGAQAAAKRVRFDNETTRLGSKQPGYVGFHSSLLGSGNIEDKTRVASSGSAIQAALRELNPGPGELDGKVLRMRQLVDDVEERPLSGSQSRGVSQPIFEALSRENVALKEQIMHLNLRVLELEEQAGLIPGMRDAEQRQKEIIYQMTNLMEEQQQELERLQRENLELKKGGSPKKQQDDSLPPKAPGQGSSKKAPKKDAFSDEPEPLEDNQQGILGGSLGNLSGGLGGMSDGDALSGLGGGLSGGLDGGLGGGITDL